MVNLCNYRNYFFVGKNELAKELLINNSDTFATFSFSISIPLEFSALAQASAITQGLSNRYTNKDLQKVTKLAINLFVQS